MKKLILLCILLVHIAASAHDAHYETTSSRLWYYNNTKDSIRGTFYLLKNTTVYIETQDSLLRIPLYSLSEKDKHYVHEKTSHIHAVNDVTSKTNTEKTKRLFFDDDTVSFILISIILISIIGWLLFIFVIKKKYHFFRLGTIIVCFLSLSGFIVFVRQQYFVTDPHEIEKAFLPFNHKVSTRWDDSYFYVESIGLPDHEMMKGIRSWQQQVPIPQCYTGNNAWSIPLRPSLAAVPVPVNQNHFLRGAIAIAVNGIPIFNPYTNTGVDAYLDGQLDEWGGHSGRADDYHYHIAPLHLYEHTSHTLPIAYALDGFAVFGEYEPNGTPQTALDENHGHFGPSGIYHYHASTQAPYMIKNMVGTVTEDATLQIIPQAQAQGVRPFLQPLKGATITSCVPLVNNNGYELTYIVNQEEHKVLYSWNNKGDFTYNFLSPSGSTTATYTSKKSCLTVSNIVQELNNQQSLIVTSQNSNSLSIICDDHTLISSIKNIRIYSIEGKLVFETNDFSGSLSIPYIPFGNYLITFHTHSSVFSRTIKI
ncbi:MAG TPA: YHYH protein [Candidatus Kapabacteria bacterium]|jgi:hypothetical protein|nr:YHYH protein [Candidatus Kapabacteria bacterium]